MRWGARYALPGRMMGFGADPAEREPSPEYLDYGVRVRDWFKSDPKTRGAKPTWTGRYRYADQMPGLRSEATPSELELMAMERQAKAAAVAAAAGALPPEVAQKLADDAENKRERMEQAARAREAARDDRQRAKKVRRRKAEIQTVEEVVAQQEAAAAEAALPMPQRAPIVDPDAPWTADPDEQRRGYEREAADYALLARLAAEDARQRLRHRGAGPERVIYRDREVPGPERIVPGPERVVEKIVERIVPGAGPSISAREKLRREIERLIPMAEHLRYNAARHGEYQYLANKINVLMAVMEDPEAALDGMRRRFKRGTAAAYAKDAARYLRKGDCRLAQHHLNDAYEAAGAHPKRTVTAKLNRLAKRMAKKCKIR